ncbi:MAG TPA: type II toxin-antitoxin system VapC family toxin [Rhizomicrobium sp.]|nr:type II toxin-antitoxin system VapC family toxin [Rhizomicrobium sp.]
MITLVIDASVAIKWIVEEEGTPEALALRHKAKLIAPDFLAAECANILWKKVQRKELTSKEAHLAARLLQAADIELLPMRPLLEAATKLAIALDHPAYDCIYLALAVEKDCKLVTADERLLRRLEQTRRPHLRAKAMSLVERAKPP